MNGTGMDWLAAAAQSHPGGLALAAGDAELTYAELLERAGPVATSLAEDGVGRGGLVAIDLAPGIEFAVALHGVVLAGAVAQPLGRDAQTVIDEGWVERRRPSTPFVRSSLARRDPAAPLARIMTSGTSGEPKAVDLTGGNFLASALGSRTVLGSEPDDRWLCCLPLNHVGGLSILIRSVIYATAAVIEDGFDADRVAALLEGGEVTIASLVPTQLVRLLDAGAAVDRPRLLLVGGGPLSLDLLEEAQGRGATVVQTYGLTEACSQVCTLAPEEARKRVGSAGRPLPGTDVRIVDDEIQVRGPTVAVGSLASDGWLHTGDLGRLDDDGYLWVEGRRDDLIVSGGENVRPERVEATLREHPSVADVAVAGVDDREWGQAVVAFVVPGPGPEPSRETLLGHARESLARHEVPKRIEFIDELPRTASGKLQRRKLLSMIYAPPP